MNISMFHQAASRIGLVTKTVRREQAAKEIRKNRKEFDDIKIKSTKNISIESNTNNHNSTFDDLFKDIKPFDEIEI
jgi:hypothetical protein